MFSVIQGFFPKGLPASATVQRFATGRAVALPANVHVPSHGGQPLPPAVRQKMEAVFGTSFADVRVHVGPHASSLGALAFTRGSNIHFAPGHYNPVTPQGQQVLAHELAHVVQQRTGRVRNPFGAGTAIVEDEPLEREAERMRVMASMNRMPVQAKMVVQRSSEAVYEDLDAEEEDVKKIDDKFWNSRCLYRVMPESEYIQTAKDHLPHCVGHFLSPDKSYVETYIGKKNTGSSSTHVVEFQLNCTFLELVTQMAKEKKLHSHHFKSYWNATFGKLRDAKKGESHMSIKAEKGTPTITPIVDGSQFSGTVKGLFGGVNLLTG